MYEGWGVARLGDPARGIDLFRRGLEEYGDTIWRPCFLGFFAETLLQAGRVDEARAALTEAFEREDTARELAHRTETLRLSGELHLARGEAGVAEAEAAFRRAIETARAQEAKAYELRAATSLTRLLRAQGRDEEARPTLVDVFGWFTEGFGTEDLREAKVLLDEMG
jgi:predicted ATPase